MRNTLFPEGSDIMKDNNNEKRSITVVTGFRGGNYGTKLQSTALCKYFENAGFETSILEKFTYMGYFLKHPDIGFARVLKRTISKNDTKRFFDDKEHYYYSKEREERLKAYDEENYNTISITTREQFDQAVKNNRIFVVGSDIIWQPAMGVPGYWFLDFIYHTRLKRFSYATSIGANELPPKYYHYYRKYLNKFSAIGVREKTAIELLRPIINGNVVQVIDPTLLHGPEFWDRFAEKACFSDNDIKVGHFVFCYFVMYDPKYWEYMKLVRDYLVNNPETSQYKIVVLPMHRLDETQPYTVITEGTPYEFVYLIKNANFIVTDSFHACAFSLNYKKEFYLLRRSRKDEDSKYDDFFNRYGLEDRSIKDEKTFSRNTSMDYAAAHKKLSEDRLFADNFIRRALS